VNLEEMKDRLRARLNERGVQDAFRDDEDLIPLLNEGARYVAKKLLAINRRINVVWDYADIVKGIVRYPCPEDMLFEIEVWYGDPTAPTIDPTWPRPTKLQHVEPNRGKTGYFMDGMWLNLTFDPPADIVGGLVLQHCAALSMIDGGDIPAIPQDLHMAIVVSAERYAVPQVGEAGKQQLAEIQDLLGDLSSYYKKENAEQPAITVQGLQYGVHGRASSPFGRRY
jgi:hypothetical protein